ncbi:hypothetical protein [Stenotrophomonas maltophilia]|uniref:hypothetical protein n=1 Tax=Stenotrophomonas maltophilia TaxID=40324 RepID=UPI0013DC500B|nr:hypothetical protein [Stenotrophomonas maltophilia]
MTISADDRRKKYFGNGVARMFTGPRAFQDSHIQVLTGTEPPFEVVPSSEYVVSGMGGRQTSVTFNAAPADGVSILIVRVVPLDQPTDITNQGAFLPEIHEDAFDYRVMQIQQTADGNVKLPIEVGGGVSPFLPTPQPLHALRWNGTATKIENYLPTEFSAPGGSNLIGWRNAGAGAVVRPVEAKLRETVSAADFETLAQAVAAAAGKPFNLLSGGWGGAPFVNEIPTGKIRVIAGTIRQNVPPNQHTWSFISDAAHVPVGFRTTEADISANAANLVLTFPEVFKRVITLVVVPDETLASQWGLQCGSSVSLDSIAINMSINCEVGGRVWFDGTTWQHKIQSMGQLDVDGNTPVFSAGNLTVGHPFTPGSANNPILVSPSTNNGAVVPLRPAHKLAPSESAFVVNFIDDAGTGLVTTASTRMSFVYKKSFAGAIRVDNTGASANLPLYQGNLWLFGIMEAE